MTQSEMKYLIAVHTLERENVGVKLTEIAEKMGVTKVSVYRAVERLEKNGYIKRNERNKVVMTEMGKASLSEYMVLTEFAASNMEIYGGLQRALAYEEALSVVCALGDAGRERLRQLIFAKQKEN